MKKYHTNSHFQLYWLASTFVSIQTGHCLNFQYSVVNLRKQLLKKKFGKKWNPIMLKPGESALYPQTKMSAILGKLWVIPSQDFHSEYNDLENVHLFGTNLLSESSKALHSTSLCDPSIIHYSASRQFCQNLVRVIKTSSTRKPAATDTHSQPYFQDWWSKPWKMLKYFHLTKFWKGTPLNIFHWSCTTLLRGTVLSWVHVREGEICQNICCGEPTKWPQLILLVTGGDGPHWDEKCSRIRDEFWEVDVTSAFHGETGPAHNQTRSRLALKSLVGGKQDGVGGGLVDRPTQLFYIWIQI